jgi:hypothetical protein
MDQFKKPHPKQPEPDSQIPTRQEDPGPMKPQNEEPEKHQTGHQLATRSPRPAPDEGQSRHRDKSRGRS